MKHEQFYYQCINQDYVIERHCAMNEIFNAEIQSCAPFSPPCYAHELNILWSDPSSYEHYFRCITIGQSIREQCSEGLTFIFQIQMCIQMTQTTSIIQRAPNCTFEQLHLRWPDPAHDRNYFICTNIGEYQLYSCLNGFIFEFSLQMCIADPQATMTPAITESTTTQFNQTTSMTTKDPFSPLECLYDDLHLLWPVIGYIYDFYICINIGHAERRNCPQGMIFVFEMQVCTEDPRIPTTTSLTTSSTTLSNTISA
ncbi:hypothetical protein PVAND_001786 [Polypedilum vanderplanki]|uniref:Uncharacterized protein n=1 Tax=Polypedilum vanderplanki TaxID=319348 RepID=A0A9J6BP01_POLVA|nr:hypothetical protein PVAND_001786 [Polypedilum vanderplanki]